MPPSTDARIEALCARIGVLCRQPYNIRAENELRKLAKKLRGAVSQHVRTAKSSLGAKKSAIVARDPDRA